MPRFVILYHRTPAGFGRPAHWDLMFEHGSRLLTWALSSAPGKDECIAAEQLPDHDAEYLDYEGPVSGGRGHVARWDQGSYEESLRCDTAMRVILHGQRVRGRAVLRRDHDGQRWWFVPED